MADGKGPEWRTKPPGIPFFRYAQHGFKLPEKEQRLASWEVENISVELDLNLYHPEAAMLHSELQEKVAAVVRELPPKCQMVYKLIREDGFSYKETGAILEISEKTVDRHLSKAVQRLREAVIVYLR